MEKIDLFVPGRLCLFGEHSDWAGEYRKTDKTVLTGKCIVSGTDQGIYATAEKTEEGFHISQILPDGSDGKEKSYSLEPDSLRKTAESASFDSYAAGTASIILNQHPELGLKIEIKKRDLPLQKGLSSSAATCVLVARSFNLVHQLNLSIEEEMEYAYRGELLTGSRCGRMDQVCAYGKNPMLLAFDGDDMSASPLRVGKALHFLIVDLQAKKNTRKILNDLNHSFMEGNLRLRNALGLENHRITDKACKAIESGDAEQLGDLMKRAQSLFDEMIAPICPGELKAPKLHGILNHNTARNLAWGGKGVGSQGDGTAQFICKGNEERVRLKEILENNSGVLCYNLNL